MAQSQVFALLLAFLYGGLIMTPLLMLWHCNCLSAHGFLSICATGLMGLALMAYRLLRGQRTRNVKFLHLAINVSAVTILVYGIIVAVPGGEEDNYNPHKIPSTVVLCLLFLHVLVAAGIFLSIKQMRTRLTFAPFHDILGIWLFLCLAGCCIAGSFAISSKMEADWRLAYYISLYLAYLTVMIVVLSPFFEWELVGLL